MRLSRFVLAVAVLFGAPLGAQPRAITFDDFASVRAVSDPQIAPNRSAILYTVRTTNIAANLRLPTTFLVSLAGGAAKAFPHDSIAATEARWSPDGAHVAYITAGQLWIADATGANQRRLTALNGGASGPVWSPTGDRIAFVSNVYPDCADDACNAARDKAKEESKVKARVVDQLLYRHWNAWDEGARSHLFVVGVSGGAPVDLTAGARFDVPPGPFGGSEGYAFSPDGREIAYTAKESTREQAWSTDVNLYVVPVTGGAARNITASNAGADQNPVYSPDGRFIAFASQARPKYESDRWRMMLYNRSTGATRELLPRWDRNAESYFFAPDMRTLYIGSGDQGRDKLFRVVLDASGAASSSPTAFISGNNNTAFSMSRDGAAIAWLRDAVQAPAEVYLKENGAERQITRENAGLLQKLSMNAAEDFWFAGARGDSVHGFMVKPPNWKAGTKYPVVLLIHGGPQGAWLDNWGSRWSFQLFASIGAAVVAINPRGSTGYGQAFTDGVTQDWGGKAYEDLMKGLDAALVKYPWMDSARVAAAGGSYGGYMVNWIAGHTNRFKALVSHAGIYNLENMYGATEEIWFSEWEFGGPYWQRKAMDEQYRKWSPHLSAANFKTPTLVVHGEQDYRVPYYEGVSLFTALQRQNVPSRFVVYPDEGHWILKPQNSRLWYAEVLGWIQRWTTPKPAT